MPAAVEAVTARTAAAAVTVLPCCSDGWSTSWAARYSRPRSRETGWTGGVRYGYPHLRLRRRAQPGLRLECSRDLPLLPPGHEPHLVGRREAARAGSRSSWQRSRAGPRSAPSRTRTSPRSASAASCRRPSVWPRSSARRTTTSPHSSTPPPRVSARRGAGSTTGSPRRTCSTRRSRSPCRTPARSCSRGSIARSAPSSRGPRSTARRSAWVARTASTPSRRRSGSSSPAGRSRSTATASGSSTRSRACASASSRAPSAPTRPPSPRWSGSRASGSASSRRRARRRSSSATATPSCSRRWRCSPRRSTASRPRSATSRAPRCARSRSRSAAARRARRRCRTSATRSRPSASAGSRASCGRTRSSGSRTSPSGTSGTSPTPPPSAIVLPDSFLAVDYMLDRFAWLVEGLVVREERMRENVDVEPRPLLQPAAAARARRVGPHARRRLPARAAQRDAGVGRAARLPRASSTPTPRSPARVDLDAVFDHGAYTAHVDVVFDRLRALVATRRGGRACLRARDASRERQGARDLRARRRPAAARRVRPHLDVRRRPADADPRQGPRAHAACRRSGSPGRARSCPNHLLALGDDGRSIDLPAARDAARRVRRARLPLRLGVGRLPGDRSGLRARAAAGAARVRAAARSRS